jgi:hypothetical protein
MKYIISTAILALSIPVASARTITHIYIKNNDIVRTDIKQAKEGSLGNTYVHLDGNTCEIIDGSAATADWIKMSSDKQYLILFNDYVDMEQLKTCKAKINISQITVGDLSDMNKKKIFSLALPNTAYVGPAPLYQSTKYQLEKKSTLQQSHFMRRKNLKRPCARIPLVAAADFHQTAIIWPCHYLISPAAKAVIPAYTIHGPGKKWSSPPRMSTHVATPCFPTYPPPAAPWNHFAWMRVSINIDTTSLQ